MKYNCPTWNLCTIVFQLVIQRSIPLPSFSRFGTSVAYNWSNSARHYPSTTSALTHFRMPHPDELVAMELESMLLQQAIAQALIRMPHGCV